MIKIVYTVKKKFRLSEVDYEVGQSFILLAEYDEYGRLEMFTRFPDGEEWFVYPKDRWRFRRLIKAGKIEVSILRSED